MEDTRNDTQNNVDEINNDNAEIITPNTYNYDLSALSEDLQSARIIAPAYASRNSELGAILQYAYYAIILDNLGYTNQSRQLMQIAEQEMHHLNLLGQTLIRLGVNPIYTAYPPNRDGYFTTRFIDYVQNPRRIIEVSLCGERCAIKQYDDIISRLRNQAVIDIIRHIRENEEEHVEILNSMLPTFS